MKDNYSSIGINPEFSLADRTKGISVSNTSKEMTGVAIIYNAFECQYPQIPDTFLSSVG